MTVRQMDTNSEYLMMALRKYGHHVFAKYNKKEDINNIYIGRGSIFGNKFIPKNKSIEERIKVCIQYRDYLLETIKEGNNEILIQSIKNLKDKNVICYCSNGTTHIETGAKFCHGHVIMNISDYLNKIHSKK